MYLVKEIYELHQVQSLLYLANLFPPSERKETRRIWSCVSTRALDESSPLMAKAPAEWRWKRRAPWPVGCSYLLSGAATLWALNEFRGKYYWQMLITTNKSSVVSSPLQFFTLCLNQYLEKQRHRLHEPGAILLGQVENEKEISSPG